MKKIEKRNHKKRALKYAALENAKQSFFLWIEKWVFAFSILFTPKAVALLFVTTCLFLYSMNQDGQTRLIFEVLVAVSSSVLTAVIIPDIIEAKGNTNLAKKSTTSIRYLRALKYKVGNIADRIHAQEIKNPTSDFTEISNLISNIDKDILNSIADWGDVNPASEQLVDFFESSKHLEDIIKALKSEKDELTKQKDNLDASKQTEIGRLETEIKTKEETISNLENKLSERTYNSLNIGSASYPSLATGPSGPSLSDYLAYDAEKCKRCGNPLSPLDMYYVGTKSGLCSSCRNLAGDIGPY